METAETDSLNEFHRWAFWTGVRPERPTTSHIPYPVNARPAFLSDLFNGTDLEPQGGLVVSAVGPIQITILHRHYETVLTRSISVSPFESTDVLCARINIVLARSNWGFVNAEWKQYERTRNFGDYVPIHSIGICEGYVIEIVIKLFRMRLSTEEWDMALGSGADLRQIVKKDPIPDYWNWEAAHFVKVQILNSVAFESVTGLAAPASPISLYEYTKAGIPSLSYYPDAETSGAVVGRFPVIRTIGNIDSLRGVKHAVRLDPDGRPVGCIMCERSICDSV